MANEAHGLNIFPRHFWDLNKESNVKEHCDFDFHLILDSNKIQCIKSMLHDPDDTIQLEGLQLMNYALKNSTLKLLEIYCIDWLKTLIHNFFKNTAISLKNKLMALETCTTLFIQLESANQIKLQIKNEYLFKLTESLLTIRLKRCCKQQVILLRTILSIYPHSLGSLKMKLEKLIISYLTTTNISQYNLELIYQAALTLPYVIAMGGVNSNISKPENSFAKQYSLMCCRFLWTCHRLLDFILMEQFEPTTLEKASCILIIDAIPTFANQNEKKQKLESDSNNSTEMTNCEAAFMYQVMLFSLFQLLTTKTSTPVEIPFTAIMQLISRILKVNKLSKKDTYFPWNHMMYFTILFLPSVICSCKEKVCSMYQIFVDVYFYLLDEVKDYSKTSINYFLRKEVYIGLEILFCSCNFMQPGLDNKLLVKLLTSTEEDFEKSANLIKSNCNEYIDFNNGDFLKTFSIKALSAFMLAYGKHTSSENCKRLFDFVLKTLYSLTTQENLFSLSSKISIKYELLYLLKVSLMNCGVSMNPPINYAASAFQFGLMDSNIKIIQLCKESLIICSMLTHKFTSQ